MTDLAFEIGTVLHADSDLAVIESSAGTSYYYGDFRFTGNDWNGTITDLFHYQAGKISYYAQDDVLGFAGDDGIKGVRGADRLHGNGGDDKLVGGAGRDLLKGGSGADVLNGGAGADRLTGGAGADRFEFGRCARDTVRDFQNGTDRIAFRDGADEFGDLTLRNSDGDARVTCADAKLVLEDLWVGRLDAEDVVFA